MKKIILAAIAVMTFGLANAQDVKYGVKGSLALSNLTGDTDGADVKSKIGFNAGGFAEFKLADKFSIQPEILYSLQGTKFENIVMPLDGDFVNSNLTFNLSYINIPVMFKYYVADKFSIEAGPQIGFLTSAKGLVKIDGYPGEIKESVKEMFKSTDFTLNLGCGYNFTENISAGVRYGIGLSNIVKQVSGEDFKWHNNVFGLSVGYKF